MDPTYLHDCYSVELRAKNRGRLSLVAPKYFGWATRLLTFLGQYASKDELSTQGNHFARHVKDAYKEDSDILDVFLESSRDYMSTAVGDKIKSTT
jgi:hypothetical protein